MASKAKNNKKARERKMKKHEKVIFRGCTRFQSSVGWLGLLGTNPAWHIATHHAPFSTRAFCKVQLILRCCGSGREVHIAARHANF